MFRGVSIYATGSYSDSAENRTNNQKHRTMKPRSAFFTAALAAIGFAFTIPQASALPDWKTSPAHLSHNHKKDEKKQEAQKRECCSTTCVDPKKGSAESAAKKDKKQLRPYFERKRGLPAFSRGR